MFWNVSAMPSFVIRCGGSPEMGSPSRATEPEVIGKRPVTQLKAEVLPAPLGPIIDRISPRSRLKLTSETARSPPKRLLTWASSSRANSGDPLHRGERFAFSAAFQLDLARAAG